MAANIDLLRNRDWLTELPPGTLIFSKEPWRHGPGRYQLVIGLTIEGVREASLFGTFMQERLHFSTLGNNGFATWWIVADQFYDSWFKVLT